MSAPTAPVSADPVRSPTPLPELDTPHPAPGAWARLERLDEVLAVLALALMVLVPLVELAARPLLGAGGENASVLVQHLGLVMTMAGALAAERHGHLTSLGSSLAQRGGSRLQAWASGTADLGAAAICALLALASGQFVLSEVDAPLQLAYGIPVWWVQAFMPLGFGLISLKLALRLPRRHGWIHAWALLLPLLAFALGLRFEEALPPLGLGVAAVALLLLLGSPVFAVLGALALLLFWSDGLPLASVPLSHYQITVNPSLPALPLYTLAGLVMARSGAAERLSRLFVAAFGGGVRGSVVATALLCSGFTAFTGGSGVTILALGGLLLPLLLKAGYPERRGIGLVTSASALGVLLAPSVPLILYAVLARVPIADMFLAGLLPALLMVAVLLLLGGFLRRDAGAPAAPAEPPGSVVRAAWAARWELAAPLVALGSLGGGLATPVESAALTAAYALFTQALVHRELRAAAVGRLLLDAAQIIGGVLLILGMALALTNFMVDAGIPDRAVEWVQSAVPNRHVFLLLLCLFLFPAAALMEIYAAIVVLVPLLLPLVKAYGIDPIHFGVLFLAAMEVGFLCPPAGMNIYFASAMFRKSIQTVAVSVLPAMGAIFVGTLLIAMVPALSTALPGLMR
ncbi:MAG: TRAP transporter large permease subunit [Burkholderiales bacterium]|nr:TRAP transporter large permease subunit [Burkholderiales bacterium]